MSRSRRITLLASIVTTALVAALAVLSVVAVTVPGVCEKCHSVHSIAPGAGDGSHKGVACLQCHAYAGVADRAELAMAVPLMIVRSAPDGVAEVSQAACLKCHPKVMKEVTESGGLRIDHESCALPGMSCATCHDATIHGQQGSTGKLGWERSLGMEECLSCHDAEGASQDCDICHDGKMERTRLSSGVWTLTHGPDWKTKHGLGGTHMCTACHTGSDCAKCHGIELPHRADFSRTHGKAYLSAKKSCITCHAKKFCTDCHAVAMPHPATFLEQHKSIVGKIGDKRCYSCHLQKDCKLCHDRHVHPGWARQASEHATGSAR